MDNNIDDLLSSNTLNDDLINSIYNDILEVGDLVSYRCLSNPCLEYGVCRKYILANEGPCCIIWDCKN